MPNRESPTALPRGFRGDIQGLRAVAVGAVVLYHAGVPFVPGGYVGVDIFFVISGFLITSHLVAGLRRDGRIVFSTFYARRIRRILPASFTVLALSVVAALIWYPPLLMREVWAGAVATAFYIPNLLFAYQGTDYLAETAPSLFQHYWSLGVEEQFYLAWPLLLALLFTFAKRPRTLFVLVLCLVLISFLLGVVVTFREPSLAFFLLPTRAWELGVGGLVALALIYKPLAVPLGAAPWLGWIGISGIAYSVLFFSKTTPFPGFWAALPVASTAAVIWSGYHQARFGPERFLSQPGFLFLGLVSYSLYLVHWPLLVIPQAVAGFENPLPIWLTVLLGSLSVPIAWLLYRLVEEPARRWKWLADARPRRSIWLAVGASLAAVVFATAAFTFSTRTTSFTSDEAAPTELSRPPSSTGFVPANLQPSLEDASEDLPASYADGCHLSFSEDQPQNCVYGDPNSPRIVLFGDSHAAQWLPALVELAESTGLSIENHTKSSCPSVDIDVTRKGIPYRECTTWRNAVIERLNATNPALVIIANFPKEDVTTEAWGEGLRDLVAAIPSKTLVLADTPAFASNPVVCLSAHLTDTVECSLPRSSLETPIRESEEEFAEAAGAEFLDLTDYFCDTKHCPTVMGNTLVYRDEDHITATMSRKFENVLGDVILKFLK